MSHRCCDYCSDSYSAPFILSRLQQILPRELAPGREQDAQAEIRTCHTRKVSRVGGTERKPQARRGEFRVRQWPREGARAPPRGGACGRRACAGRGAGARAWAKTRTVAETARGDGRWPTRLGMEHLERCAWIFRGTLVRAAVRRYLPWGLVASMLAGSLLKELSPLPESYLSNKRNVLNV